MVLCVTDKFTMEEFVSRQKELLALEREAELEEAAQLLEGVPLRELCQRGLALQRLSIAATRTGLYGRTLVTFTSVSEFPAHTITSGDIVGVRDKGLGSSFSSYTVSTVTHSCRFRLLYPVCPWGPRGIH